MNIMLINLAIYSQLTTHSLITCYPIKIQAQSMLCVSQAVQVATERVCAKAVSNKLF